MRVSRMEKHSGQPPAKMILYLYTGFDRKSSKLSVLFTVERPEHGNFMPVTRLYSCMYVEQLRDRITSTSLERSTSQHLHRCILRSQPVRVCGLPFSSAAMPEDRKERRTAPDHALAAQRGFQ